MGENHQEKKARKKPFKPLQTTLSFTMPEICTISDVDDYVNELLKIAKLNFPNLKPSEIRNEVNELVFFAFKKRIFACSTPGQSSLEKIEVLLYVLDPKGRRMSEVC